MPLPSKLTIQKLYRSGLSHAELARKFGVSHQPIHQVLGRSEGGYRKPSEAEVRELRKLRRSGWSAARLAERYGVTGATVRNVVTGRTWFHVEAPSRASAARDPPRRGPWGQNQSRS